jgi:multidrug efflux pump
LAAAPESPCGTSDRQLQIRGPTGQTSCGPSVSCLQEPPLRRALADLDRIAEAKLPPGFKREHAGQSLEYKTSSTSLYFRFLLAIAFIYLVLAAQFESLVHPFTILLSVPLAVRGALLALFVFRQSLNIYSQIGSIMRIGLVTKNAILIVELSNQLRAKGGELIDAVVEAATIRLGPILVASFSTIFGILPIAIGLGAGAESRGPLGLVVVGGMFFSTFLTLLLVPVLYTLLARFTKAGAAPAEPAEAEPIPGEPGAEWAGAAPRV